MGAKPHRVTRYLAMASAMSFACSDEPTTTWAPIAIALRKHSPATWKNGNVMSIVSS